MREMEPASVDAIVTDPPYGLAFMGKAFDTFKAGDIAMRRNPEMDAVNTGASRQGGRQRYGDGYQKRQARDMRAYQDAMEEVFAGALRVAKPGAHLLAFGGTRTFHRLTCAIEDAGWEIRDCLGWIYGSGFPKSLDVSKAIDKMAGAEREKIGDGQYASRRPRAGDGVTIHMPAGDPITAPATDAAKKWQGFGTALKPAWEPIILARAPLAGTVAATVCEHGTGALNIDGCRVDYKSDADKAGATPQGRCTAKPGALAGTVQHDGPRSEFARPDQVGRWPANLIHDGSDEVLGIFPMQSGGGQPKRRGEAAMQKSYGGFAGGDAAPGVGRSSGSASRFFYCAKASRAERGEGNVHPTVKPLALMRYLCRLITPPGGLVLDPFAGSGSTLIAAVAEGFEAVGIEREAAYAEIARQRFGPLDQFAEATP
jgi:site-specific DNA-methyltransferase (adenine-specific)